MAKLSFPASEIASQSYVDVTLTEELRDYYSKSDADTTTLVNAVIAALPIYNGEVESV